MPIATLTNIEKTFGKRVLFDRLNLNIYPGERIGLIGDNGSGKTSLFKVLVGQMLADAGVAAVSRSIKVGYLTQDPVFDPANTVIDEAELAFADLHRLSHRLRELEHDMAALTGEALEKVLRQYQNAQHEFDVAGGYAWRHRLEATLMGVGLDRPSWTQSVTTLSGGQRSRLALARLLISEPDLLLLDEPTNHLDLSAIEWLERYLLNFNGSVVIISHDRFLLDRLVTRIVWLTGCRLKSYKGNYSAFVQQRQMEELAQQRQYQQQQAEIAKQQEFVRRFQAGQRSREARGRKTRLERFLRSDAVVQRVARQKTIRLSLDTNQRAGDQVLDVRGLSKSYGQRVLWQDVCFRLRRGERVGMIGPNGSGKTTLLEALLGLRDADHGHIKWGANLNIGYYDQNLDDFDPDNTVMEEVRGDRDVKDQEMRDLLALMLFRGEEVDKPMGLLSGGERARVRLAQLLLDRPNVLLLDEPTNHLDIASREALERALGDFAGTLLCVSHDRYFLNRIVTRLLVLQPPTLVDFTGSYTAWQAKMEAQQSAEAARQAAVEKSRPAPDRPQRPTPRKDNPYLRPFGRLTLEELERLIQQTESDLAAIQEQCGDPRTFRDPAGAQKLQEEYDALSVKLQQLEEEYFAREG